MKTIIEKKNEEITYKRVNTTIEFEVNKKPLKVYITENWDEMEGSDYDIDEKDLATLTDDEREAFEDEGIWNLCKMEDGEKVKN